MRNKGHWGVCFSLSRTRGSICPSTSFLPLPSKQETPHSSTNIKKRKEKKRKKERKKEKKSVLAYLWCQSLCWRKHSNPASLSKKQAGSLYAAVHPPPSTHLFSAGQPNNSIMNMKCLLIDVYGSWSQAENMWLLDTGLTWLCFCFT